MKRNKELIYATAQINLKGMVLGEKADMCYKHKVQDATHMKCPELADQQDWWLSEVGVGVGWGSK